MNSSRSDRFMRVYKNFGYGFVPCRSSANLKYCWRVMFYNSLDAKYRERALGWNPASFTMLDWMKYLERFGIVLTSDQLDLYQKMYRWIWIEWWDFDHRRHAGMLEETHLESQCSNSPSLPFAPSRIYMFVNHFGITETDYAFEVTIHDVILKLRTG